MQAAQERDGLVAGLNRLRHATKPTVGASGLTDYARRFYLPTHGGWASRDPISERGGRNLLNFVANDPINRLDPVGLSSENRPGISVTLDPLGGLTQKLGAPLPEPVAARQPRSATSVERFLVIQTLGTSPLAINLLNRYMDATGQIYVLSEEEMKETRPFVDLRSDLGRQATALTGEGCCQKATVFVLSKAYEGKTLARFFVTANGDLCRTSKTGWKFTGKMGFVDTFDFDARPFGEGGADARSTSGEIMVRLGSVGLAGAPFLVRSVDVNVTQTDAQDEAQWSGTGQWRIGSGYFLNW